MDIAVGKTADMNPEVNIGSLLQIIKMAGLDKITGTETNQNDVGNETEKGSGIAFLQILQQKLAQFLQSDHSGASQELITKQELSAALENLLRGDQATEGAMLPEFALLAIAGQMEGLLRDASEIADEAASNKIPLNIMTGIFQEEVSGDAQQAKQLLVKNESGIIFSKSTELFAEKNAAQADNVSELNANVQPNDASAAKQGFMGEFSRNEQAAQTLSLVQTDSLKALSQGAFSAKDTEIKGTVPIEAQDHLLSRQNGKDRQWIPEVQINKTSGVEQQAKTLTNYEDIQKNVLIEGKDKVTEFNTTEKVVLAAKGSGENQDVKISAGVVGAVQENKSRVKISGETKTEEESLETHIRMQNQTEKELNKKTHVRTEAHLKDQQTSLSVNETQKNMAGKVAASMNETAGMIEKVKNNEVKIKTAPVEKNIDINSLNSTVVSGNQSTKTAMSNISSAQIINRVAAEFNESLTSEGGRVKITLTPPSLGTLEMDVTVQNSKVRILLTAENQDVQKMLSGNLDLLKGALQSQGLTIERCDVMMQDRRDQYSQGFNQQAFNQEQSTERQNDSSESYNQNVQTAQTGAMQIGKSTHQASWRLGNISIFA